MESRLVPVNAILDLALADGLNPAPLADAGWAAAARAATLASGGQGFGAADRMRRRKGGLDAAVVPGVTAVIALPRPARRGGPAG